MRAILFAVSLFVAVGCGGTEPGFRIDDVSISPNDIPLNSQSSADIKITASVYNDRHEVFEVLARSDEALLWVDLEQGSYPKWSITIPIAIFEDFEIGDYWIDIEARDDGNRVRRIEDAVRFQIRDD